MAKLTNKIVNNILNDYKISLFISKTLSKFKVNHYDFFEYIKENEDVDKEYNKILNYNTLILEDQIAEQCYKKDGNSKILLEMIRYGNKDKYVNKQQIDINLEYNELSDEQINELIEKTSASISSLK